MDNFYLKPFLFNDFSLDTFFEKPFGGIEETDSAFIFSLDMPGVLKDDVSIEVKNNHLIVQGIRKTKNNSSSYQKSWALPSSANQEKVEANLESGVLSVVIEKAESKKTQISITSNQGFLDRFKK